MIESNNPEIDVDELMGKIREEVTRRKSQVPLSMINSPESTAKNPTSSAMMAIISHIEALIRNAESRAYIRTKWPDKLNRFPFNLTKGLQKFALKGLNFLFKDQREVNLNLLQSFKQSLVLNKQLIEEITVLKTKLDERRNNVDIHLQGINESLGALTNQVQQTDESLGTLKNQVQQTDESLGTLTNQVQQTDESLSTLTNQVQQTDESLGTLTNRVQQTDESLGAVNNRLQGLEMHLMNLDSRIQGINERHIRNDSYLKNDLMQQKHLISLFLEEVRQRLPEPLNQQQLQTLMNEESHLLDAFYVAFEDQFRGSREDILNRLKVYLPLIEEAKIGTPESLIVDVGCGRGEWLELLRESGYTARGIDINRVMLEQCRSRDMEVTEADAIAYLQSLPDNSLGAVTGFHIIEHLPFAMLIKLFDETFRVLQPGGLVIFETPNPDNVLVGSNKFYLDPTHKNPLPSAMIKFVTEMRGLCRVEILKLHPVSDKFIRDNSDLAQHLNEHFYSSQDYAVIGYKL